MKFDTKPLCVKRYKKPAYKHYLSFKSYLKLISVNGSLVLLIIVVVNLFKLNKKVF